MLRALSLFSVLSLMIANAEAASFNCNLAKSPSEVAICNDKTLSRLDEEMSERFFKVRNLLPKLGQVALRSANKTFLQRRNRCGSDRQCLTFQNQNFMERTCEIAQSHNVACE